MNTTHSLVLTPRFVRRLRRAARVRGATLVEVLIVVAIIAMIAGGVAVFAIPQFKKAQINSANTGARVIRGAVQTFQGTENDTSCPTVSQLVEKKYLDPGQSTVDPWGQPYGINCNDDEVVVTSNGPDKKKGSGDDIRVPPTSAGAQGG